MSLLFRKQLRLGKHAWLNISRRGVSASVQLGRVTINSGRRVSVRLGKGFFWRN